MRDSNPKDKEIFENLISERIESQGTAARDTFNEFSKNMADSEIQP